MSEVAWHFHDPDPEPPTIWWRYQGEEEWRVTRDGVAEGVEPGRVVEWKMGYPDWS